MLGDPDDKYVWQPPLTPRQRGPFLPRDRGVLSPIARVERAWGPAPQATQPSTPHFERSDALFEEFEPRLLWFKQRLSW